MPFVAYPNTSACVCSPRLTIERCQNRVIALHAYLPLICPIKILWKHWCSMTFHIYCVCEISRTRRCYVVSQHCNKNTVDGECRRQRSIAGFLFYSANVSVAQWLPSLGVLGNYLNTIKSGTSWLSFQIDTGSRSYCISETLKILIALYTMATSCQWIDLEQFFRNHIS